MSKKRKDLSEDSDSPMKKENPYNKMPYVPKEDRAIVDFIIDKNYYELVGGNAIWIEAQSEKICPGRTWQSMKERFRKQIKPKIRTYNLPYSIERKFFDTEQLSKSDKDFAKAKHFYKKKSCVLTDDDDDSSSGQKSKSTKRDGNESRFRYPTLNMQRMDESPMVNMQNKKESKSSATVTKSVPSSSICDFRNKSKKKDKDEPQPSCSKRSAAPSKSSDELEILCEDVGSKTPSKQEGNSKSAGTPRKKKTPSKFDNVGVERRGDDSKTLKLIKKIHKSKTSRLQITSSSDSSNEELNAGDRGNKVKKIQSSSKKSAQESVKIDSSDDDCYIKSSQKTVLESITIDSTSEEEIPNSEIIKAVRKETPQKNRNDSEKNSSSEEGNLFMSSKTNVPNTVEKVTRNGANSKIKNSNSDKIKEKSKVKKTPKKVIDDDYLSSEENNSVTSKRKPIRVNLSSEENISDSDNLTFVPKNKSTPQKIIRDKSSNEENYPTSRKRKRLSRRRSLQKNYSKSSSSEDEESQDLMKRFRNKKRKHENKESALKEVLNVKKSSHCCCKNVEEAKGDGGDIEVKNLRDAECDVKNVGKFIRKKRSNVPKESKGVQATWNGECFVDDDEEDVMDIGIQVNFDVPDVSNVRNVKDSEASRREGAVMEIDIASQECLEKGQVLFDNYVNIEDIVKKEPPELVANPLSEEIVEIKIVPAKVTVQDKEKEKLPLEENVVDERDKEEPVPSFVTIFTAPEITENKERSECEKEQDMQVPQLVANPMANEIVKNKERKTSEKQLEEGVPMLVLNPKAREIIENEQKNSGAEPEEEKITSTVVVNPKNLNGKIKQKKKNLFDGYSELEKKKMKVIIQKLKYHRNLE